MPAINKLISPQEFNEMLNGYLGNNDAPLDQLESVILNGLNTGRSFSEGNNYDLKAIGKGFKSGSIKLLRDTRKSKIFASSFHVSRVDRTNKLASVTLYTFEYSKNENESSAKWRLLSKIKIPNSSDYNYPLKKLYKYIHTQIQFDGEDLSLKYNKIVGGSTPEELETYSSMIDKVKNLDNFSQVTELLQSIFDTNETAKLTKYLLDNELIPDDIQNAIEVKSKTKAIKEFETMLENSTLNEHDWQKWFEKNSWVLGTDFVNILGERRIDSGNTSDYLAESYDGFLDIVEIKNPNLKETFWDKVKDHNNYFPSKSLTKAIMQSSKYIISLEEESNSIKFRERVKGTVVKPRCFLIFGRSQDWNKHQKKDFRVLNSSYHNIFIMTYDQVLERAKRILDLDEKDAQNDNFLSK